MEGLKDQIDEIEEQLWEAEDTSAVRIELEEVKRKIEGEAELTLKMDEARGTFEKDMETLESMLPFSFSSLSLSLSLTETLPAVS